MTGGAGYVGSIVTEELLRAGHRVTVFDDLSQGNPSAVPAGAGLVIGDIADRDALRGAFSAGSPQAVMHFAALIEAAESMRVPERYFRNNTVSSLTLLAAMLEHGTRQIVFSSTAALYGNPERTPIVESAPLCPTNAYGEWKLLIERILEWFHPIHRLRYASLRYFNAAGATVERGEDHSPESHLIPLVLKTALGLGAEIAIYGSDYPTPDDTCIRDYIHVADLAQAHLMALDALSERGQVVYNLGNGSGFSVREVIEVARQVTRRPIPVVERPRRPGDPAILVASSEKIRGELGWKPQYSDLEDIVRSAWVWHQGHPRGYQN